jgi:hypothetical protein
VSARVIERFDDPHEKHEELISMSKQEDNKAIVVRWFTEFWGKDVDLTVIDDIAAPDMLLKYSLHEPRRGHDDIKGLHDRLPRCVPGSQFLGYGRFDRRG